MEVFSPYDHHLMHKLFASP